MLTKFACSWGKQDIWLSLTTTNLALYSELKETAAALKVVILHPQV
jgi:hypothetical protein